MKNKLLYNKNRQGERRDFGQDQASGEIEKDARIKAIERDYFSNIAEYKKRSEALLEKFLHAIDKNRIEEIKKEF